MPNSLKIPEEFIHPKILYHSSPVNDLVLVEPQKRSYRDPNEGPVIFATPDPIYATQFLVKTDGSWANGGFFDGVSYFVISDKERFLKADKGGTIYELSPNDFYCNPEMNMGWRTWVSKVSVKPLAKHFYASGLEAMLNKGVQVYFVERRVYKDIERSKDHGQKILRGLISENKKIM